MTSSNQGRAQGRVPSIAEFRAVRTHPLSASVTSTASSRHTGNVRAFGPTCLSKTDPPNEASDGPSGTCVRKPWGDGTTGLTHSPLDPPDASALFARWVRFRQAGGSILDEHYQPGASRGRSETVPHAVAVALALPFLVRARHEHRTARSPSDSKARGRKF